MHRPKGPLLSLPFAGCIAIALVLSAASVPAWAGVAGSVARETVMTQPLLPERLPIGSFSPYANAHFNLTMNVPTGWPLDEHYTVDSVFGFVLGYVFTGPPNSESHLGFNVLELRMVPTTNFGGTFATLSAYADATRVQKNVVGGTIVSDVSTTFQGLPAREIELTYLEQRPPWTVASPDPPVTVAVRKRWIAFEKDHHFYEICLESSAADWALYEPAYLTAKSTLVFLP